MLLTLKEAGERLAVSARTVDRLIKRGELAAVRVGGQVRIDPRAIETFIETNTEGEMRMIVLDPKFEEAINSVQATIEGDAEYQAAVAAHRAAAVEFDKRREDQARFGRWRQSHRDADIEIEFRQEFGYGTEAQEDFEQAIERNEREIIKAEIAYLETRARIEELRARITTEVYAPYVEEIKRVFPPVREDLQAQLKKAEAIYSKITADHRPNSDYSNSLMQVKGLRKQLEVVIERHKRNDELYAEQEATRKRRAEQKEANQRMLEEAKKDILTFRYADNLHV